MPAVQLTHARWLLAVIAVTSFSVAVGSMLWEATITSDPDLITTCREFETWDDAHAYWLAHLDNADVLNYLDTNGNLIPCEQLADNPHVVRQRVTMNYVCDDFDFQEQAQGWFDRWLEEYPELQGLDGDRNGIACQNLPTLDDIAAIVLRLNRLEKAGLR